MPPVDSSPVLPSIDSPATLEYRLFLDVNPNPVLVYDLETLAFLAVNTASIEHYGYSEVEFLGMKVTDIRPDESVPNFLAVVSTKSQISRKVEWRHCKKNGTIIEIELTSAPLVWFGKPARACFINDVSDRNQAEKILLQEMHHRVKNSLQTVSGLLYLQSDCIEDPKAKRILLNTRDRIQSIALVHEQLYSSKNLKNLNFNDYIRTLVEHICNSFVDRDCRLIDFQFEIDPICLAIDTMICCGLIITELLLNAIKHAFPDRRSGEITIVFRAIAPENLELVVRDNGVGISSEINWQTPQKSLGLRLLQSLVQRQLKGNIDLEISEGTSFKITFPQPDY